MKTKTIGTALFAALMSMCALSAAAQGPKVEGAAAGEEPDVMDILRKADAATRAVKAVAYQGELYGAGSLERRVPHVKGSLKVKQGKQSLMGVLTGESAGAPLMRFDGTVVEPGSSEEIGVKVASDGKRVYSINEMNGTFVQGDLPRAESLLRPAQAIYMKEYLYPTPFSDELEGKVARYEGMKTIGGVECYVVYVVYQDDSESRWYFGKADYLPRRVDRIVKSRWGAREEKAADDEEKEKEEEENAYVTTISSLDTKPSFGTDDFRLKRPKELEVKKFEPEEEEETPPLLSAGSEAPDWELATPDGKTVTLKSLRGNVVLLEFWATWCGPCKLAAPGVQKLHEQFKDKPVKVYGVNASEQGGDPVEYMKKNKLTYGLLLNGDKVADAYKVSGVPTFYVIGADGKILYASAGFMPDVEKEIAEVIKKNIKAAK